MDAHTFNVERARNALVEWLLAAEVLPREEFWRRAPGGTEPAVMWSAGYWLAAEHLRLHGKSPVDAPCRRAPCPIEGISRALFELSLTYFEKAGVQRLTDCLVVYQRALDAAGSLEEEVRTHEEQIRPMVFDGPLTPPFSGAQKELRERIHIVRREMERGARSRAQRRAATTEGDPSQVRPLLVDLWIYLCRGGLSTEEIGRLVPDTIFETVVVRHPEAALEQLRERIRVLARVESATQGHGGAGALQRRRASPYK